MSERTTTMQPGEGLDKSRTDWQRVDAMADDDIDYSDTPAFDEEFLRTVEMTFSPGNRRTGTGRNKGNVKSQ